MSLDEPETLVGARKECPLIVGRGEGETFLASAIPAFLRETRRVQYIENGEIVEITPEGTTFMLARRHRARARDRRDRLGRGDRREGRLRDLHAQGDPRAGRRAWPRRSPTAPCAPTASTSTTMGALDEAMLRDVKRIIVVACGTSYHAGLIGRYAIEEWARIPVEMDIASEYRYRNPVVGPATSSSASRSRARRPTRWRRCASPASAGATVLALTNIMGSQATRDADGVLYTRAGLEVGVAATKTFTCQVGGHVPARASSSPSCAARCRAERRAEIIADLKRIPHCIEELLAQHRRRRCARSPTPTGTRTSSSTSAATSASRWRSRARSSSRRSPTSPPTPTRRAR